jgi:hypothetical protein
MMKPSLRIPVISRPSRKEMESDLTGFWFGVSGEEEEDGILLRVVESRLGIH